MTVAPGTVLCPPLEAPIDLAGQGALGGGDPERRRLRAREVRSDRHRKEGHAREHQPGGIHVDGRDRHGLLHDHPHQRQPGLRHVDDNHGDAQDDPGGRR